ncbi:MAG: 2-dehydro-3-deoxygalactonokinase [Hyphomicrobiaceae bacterium]
MTTRKAAEASLISVDWGTTSFRAYLVAASGEILERRESSAGILAVEGGDFAGTLRAAVADWIAVAPGAAIVMSGMIGSRQGWVEAPYVSTPADAAAIASASVMLTADGLTGIRLVPGLLTRAADGRPDVIRGEETQVIGAMRLLGVTDGLMVLPGTHAKWLTVVHGTLAGFETYMTGEVFAALKGHTILGRTMVAGTEARSEGEAFADGVKLGAAAGHPGQLLNRIFSTRTRGLTGELEDAKAADYLSGLLIGAELAAATMGGARRFTIIASEALAARYRTAAALLGFKAEVAPADCVVAGHLELLAAWQAGGDKR